MAPAIKIVQPNSPKAFKNVRAAISRCPMRGVPWLGLRRSFTSYRPGVSYIGSQCMSRPAGLVASLPKAPEARPAGSPQGPGPNPGGRADPDSRTALHASPKGSRPGPRVVKPGPPMATSMGLGNQTGSTVLRAHDWAISVSNALN